MVSERSSSSVLRKTISEPQTGIEICSIVFLRVELDERPCLIQNISKFPQLKIYISSITLTYSGIRSGRKYVEFAP